MFNYTPNPYLNSAINQFQGFKIVPVPRIEETENIYPDFSGNPLFFFDQAKNEIYVKQRNNKNGSIQIIRYVLSDKPLEHFKMKSNANSYQNEINELKNDLKSIKDLLTEKKEQEDVQEL